jgi:hypothetical protein
MQIFWLMSYTLLTSVPVPLDTKKNQVLPKRRLCSRDKKGKIPLLAWQFLHLIPESFLAVFEMIFICVEAPSIQSEGS